ncbi:MAG TPA: hypothetical protein VJV03_20115 [Pyrinomonadaceae bacterium]|nr:hypothetical protein [Pyrinomonadaceae bacterium]
MKIKVLLAFCFIVCAVSSAQAQIDKWGYWENGVSEAWWFPTPQFTAQHADEAIARWKNIEDENHAAGASEWAGTYFSGSDVHGTYLRLAPRGGYVIAHVDKCQAKVVGLSYGSVEFSPSVVKLFPEFRTENTSHGVSHAHRKLLAEMRFVPVRMNAAQLLIEEKEMPALGDYVAGLGNYNYSDFHYWSSIEFLTRVGGEQSTAEDNKSRALEMIVPDEYVRYLKKPIEATIARVGRVELRKNYSYENSDGTGGSHDAPVHLTTVVVSAGTAQGLKRGMFLNLLDPKQNERVRILSVGKISSTGIIVRDLDENGREVPFDHETGMRYSKIIRGRKLTTSPF